MANLVFNVAKGRVAELYNRVDNQDPSTSRIIVVVLATSGLESGATLLDFNTLAEVVAGATNEVTNTNYARKVLTQADLTAMAADDTNDRMDIDIPDQTWLTVAAGDGWSKVLVCYDPSSLGVTNSAIVPMTMHDFVVTPDGSDITAQVATAGFFRSGGLTVPGYRITTEGEEALAAATAETILMLAGATAGKAIIDEIGFGFDGITAAAAPVEWKLKRGNSASQGSSSAATEEKDDSDDSAAANTGFHSFSSEPTYTGQALAHGEVHPQGGWLIIPVKIIIDDATNSFIGLELTAPATVNVAGHLHWTVAP